MSRRQFTDHERAMVVAEAAILGTNPTLEKYGASKSMLSLWRKKYREDAAFHALVVDLHERLYEDWASHGSAYMVKAMAKMGDLLDKADKVDDLHTIAGTVKIVGNIMVAGQALATPKPQAQKEPLPMYEGTGRVEGSPQHVPVNGAQKTVGKLGGQGGPPNGGRKS